MSILTSNVKCCTRESVLKYSNILINRAILQSDNYTQIVVTNNREYWRTLEEFPYNPVKDITKLVSIVSLMLYLQLYFNISHM